MAIALRIVIATAVVVLVFWFLLPRADFVLAIDEGKVRLKRGKVLGQFVAECQQICAEWKVERGSIRGVRYSGRVALRFSREIPPEHHQRFRNAWGMHS